MAYEGIIKFSYTSLDKDYVIPENIYQSINPYRNKLFDKTFIGQYPDGLSYGNISLRHQKTNKFYITASDTGKIKRTNIHDYVQITDCNLDANTCTYKGATLPSSETLSHHIIYKYCPFAGTVIHIHNKPLWQRLKNRMPTTAPDIEYGSIAMTKEIIALLETGDLQAAKLLVMGGHEDGIIVFGATPEEAFQIIENLTFKQ